MEFDSEILNKEIEKESAQSNQKSISENKLKREVDSLDDFEHLEDISEKLPDDKKIILDKEICNKNDSDITRANTDVLIDAPINTSATPKTAFDAEYESVVDVVNSEKELTTQLRDSDNIQSKNMDENQYKTELKLNDREDDLLGDLTQTKSPAIEPSSHDIDVNDIKKTTQDLLQFERGDLQQSPGKISQLIYSDLADKFTDSDPDIDVDDDKLLYDDHKVKFASADDLLRTESPTVLPTEQFKDVLNDSPVCNLSSNQEIPTHNAINITNLPSAEIPVKEFTIKPDEPVKEFITDDTTPVIPKHNEKEDVKLSKDRETAAKTELGIMQAEEMFLKMGLDTWFQPERLHPIVESLIYWRDPKKSGVVFGGILVILLSLAYFSLISVTAYLSLIVLTGTISFRIYKNIMQAVQKTSDGHPFKEFLEMDMTLPQDKVNEITELVVTHINGGVNELRRLFLVEDLIDSIKFGVLLWCLTYVGAWFNGMTLIIISFVALFTLPKVYETNKTQIDTNLDIVRSKLAEITAKVKAAVPIGKKSEASKKEQ